VISGLGLRAASGAGACGWEFLPAYAAELNPVECLWAHWRHHERPNFCHDSYRELRYDARANDCGGCAVGPCWSAPSGSRRSRFLYNYIM
jgi:hypothetical protein